MGTLSKAFGALGGFVAIDQPVADVIRHGSLVYAYTSTIPPDQAFAILTAMDILAAEPERRDRLWANQRYFLEQIEPIGLQLLSTETPIIPVLIGDEELATSFARVLRAANIYVDVFQFPAAPPGQSRLRFQLNAGHTREHIDRVVTVLAQLARENPQVTSRAD
jgi:glycine C-acetyltransferase